MSKEKYRKIDPSKRKPLKQIIDRQISLLESVKDLTYKPDANYMKKVDEGFQPPTTGQLYEILAEEGVTLEEFGKIVGAKSRSVTSWTARGDNPSEIPEPLLRHFLILVGRVPAI